MVGLIEKKRSGQEMMLKRVCLVSQDWSTKIIGAKTQALGQI